MIGSASRRSAWPPIRSNASHPTLKDPTLLRQQCYVNGQWVGADDGATKPVTNPANGSVIGSAPVFREAETRRAIDAANAAWPGWRAKPAKERSAILRKWYELMLANHDDLALILTTEQGKPLAESKGEVGIAAAYVEWFAEEAKRVYGDVIPTTANDRRLVVVKQPVGVCAAITPWNFPCSMITRKVSPALAAGCTVVIKPAEKTPYSAFALAELAHRAGFPPGVLNIITGKASAIGGEMTSQPDRAQAVVHRLHRDRPAADGAIGADDQEGVARARRQRALRRVRRCRSRCRGGRRADLEVPQRRPDLCVHEPLFRAEGRVRHVRREVRGEGQVAQGRPRAPSRASRRGR